MGPFAGIAVRGAVLAAIFVAVIGVARADDFHGFDPATATGQPISSDAYRAMVADAEAKTPPKNGKNYVFGFANLQRDMAFGIKTEEGIKHNAEEAGITLLVVDNRLDGPTALTNAESFIRRNVDFVIEFQIDVNFGPIIMQHFDAAHIPVIAIDIPMPGATFQGANNSRSGFMGGAFLGEAAKKRWGADVASKAYVVVGALPEAGAIPAMRTNGQLAGIKAVLPDLAADHIVKIDTKNTLQESFSQMSNVLGRIPAGAPILVVAINDQSVTGMIRAAQQVGRGDQVIAVGMGADEIETLGKEPSFLASVGYFPENYGNYLIPMALMRLAGKQLPPAVLINHVVVTKGNVCKFYDSAACDLKGPGADLSYTFPEAAYEAHLARERSNPDLKGYENLIPAH